MLREERPSSKIVTIAGYSVIKERTELYESSVFEAAGYKWLMILTAFLFFYSTYLLIRIIFMTKKNRRLLMYMNGNKNDGGNGYISLYVRMEETESLPYGWEVNVDLKLFVHNPKQHKYLAVTGIYSSFILHLFSYY